jgi:hypothetical protein
MRFLPTLKVIPANWFDGTSIAPSLARCEREDNAKLDLKKRTLREFPE